MTTFTLMFALALGVAGVRVFTAGNTEIEFDSSYAQLFHQKYSVKADAVVAAVEAPEMTFEEIKIPVQKVTVKRAMIAKKVAPKIEIVKVPEVKKVEVAHNELPFHEPVELKRLNFNGALLVNMVALYEGLPVEEKVLVAEKANPVKDEVKTTQAATETKTVADAEPEFFEYEKKEDEAAEVAAAAPETKVNETVEDIQVTVQEGKATPAEIQAEVKAVEKEVNLVAFDYSGLKQDLKDNKVPTVSMVDTQPKKQNHKTAPVTTHQAEALTAEKVTTEKSMVPSAPKFQTQMTIQGVASDLKSTHTLQGFEVRFQDNMSETLEDYGDGEVSVSYKMARPKMTRSMVLLKRGFAPTNTDLILEDGAGSVSIPALSQELVDELIAPFEQKGPVGTLLVELADETDKATIDVPFGKVITLDGDMKETTSEDFRYQLFVGVKAGNALLTYVHGNETTNKILHVHEREVTYESNFFENQNLNRVSLFQEDLLSREKSPLVTASENVKVFAKDVHGEKLDQNTYKMNFGKALLGGRNYLELTHESESVFIGTKSETELSVPSESFMRHILGSLPDSKLGNRCVIQVNLKKKVSEVEVAPESVDQALMTSAQYLDADGRFYETASGKTRKVIIVGENQGAPELDMTGKVNVKIQYLDGTHDFLGSYCSPNTYLVEQL